ncbi:DNA-processing protein DprA [Lentisalinibacter sediminis]|uniref:DNA-processing protein DprA n=1 Tax=Lentisalinibacter sediminis TaxID=2992237 RepID=UPI003869AD21
MDEETEAWVRLAEAPGLGAAEAAALVESFGSAARVAGAGRGALASRGLDADTVEALLAPPAERMAHIAGWLAEPGHHLVSRHSADYPALLAEAAGAPLVLYVNGEPGLLSMPQLAVVGSRNPTRGGERTAFEFAAHLAASGLTITSGLATGIDASAHEGALSAGGSTIAVLGTGIDRVYPAANRHLAHRIAERGALVSEFPLGSPPEAWHFPRRNRIISGMSLGTLVVEAAQRSGSLITARLAAEQGREVFAIPGSIHNALARGCHRLIRDGARLVESADDIFAELAPLAGALGTRLGEPPSDTDSAAAGAAGAGRDGDYDKLLEALAWEPADMDTLIERSGLTIDQLSSMLLILELEGEVESLPGGKFSRVRQERLPE